MDNHSIIAAGRAADIGTRVVLWTEAGGYVCPNKRGRAACSRHDPALNDRPTRPDADYRFTDPDAALRELQASVHQFILHYDVCFCSSQCHEIMRDSDFKGSHFYLDLDGTIYQTCDLYWKTNTAPADDRIGNERAVHVEMANLSWEALAKESSLYHTARDRYKESAGRWELDLPEEYRRTLRTPGFRAFAARSGGKNGWFSKRVNGKTVRMWDFTEEQYRALLQLCRGVNDLLPKIRLQVPFDTEKRRTPLGKIASYSAFCGILGHAHVQHGGSDGITRKYDPGSAFDWNRLRREFRRAEKKPKP